MFAGKTVLQHKIRRFALYYYIKGELVLTDITTAVIDAGGVGYSLTVSGTTLGSIAGKIGTEIKLFTYLSVREDAMELYGFYTQEELKAFKMLVTVSGVGAKSAISILTILSAERLAAAVIAGDSKLISKAQGIGAKTAARIVLELKDKIGKEIDAGSLTEDYISSGDTENSDIRSEALNALLVLGYSRSEAVYALKGIQQSDDIETVIKKALARLMKS